MFCNKFCKYIGKIGHVTTRLGRAVYQMLHHKEALGTRLTSKVPNSFLFRVLVCVACIKNNQPQDISAEICNCRNKHACPLQNKCMSKDIVYKATVSTGNTQDTKHYIGMTSNTFRERYRNHIKSFTHKKYSNETELSKHVWHLKQIKTDFTIKWSIIKSLFLTREDPKDVIYVWTKKLARTFSKFVYHLKIPSG